MATFVVHNKLTGVVFGVYRAGSREAALDAVARDAGYESYKAACAVTGDLDTIEAFYVGKVYDINTNEELAGEASADLITASFQAKPEGAVRARCSEQYVWWPDTDGTNTVYVEFD